MAAPSNPSDKSRGDDANLINRVRQLVRKGYARNALELLPTPAEPLAAAIEQLRAQVLVNTGAPRSAQRVLQALMDQGNQEVETLSLLGRTEKDLARTSRSKAGADQHWRAALAHYQLAFNKSGDPYPGINAATLLLRLGAADAARDLAKQVIHACHTGVSENPEQSYWDLPTIAEAHLVLGDLPAARADYARAMQDKSADLYAMGSMVRQAQELLPIAGFPADSLGETLAMPAVAVFAGHMLDTPERTRPRFTPANLTAAATALADTIADGRIDIAYCCLANGADILFAEAMLKRSAELHVVLPIDVDAFEAFSVRTTLAEPRPWVQRYRNLLQQAASVTVTSDGLAKADGAALRYCNGVVLGLAQLKARELGAKVQGVALWDSQPGLPGGTADCVALWQQADIPIRVIAPDGTVTAQVPQPSLAIDANERPLLALVFADVVGYSRFSEEDVSVYYEDLLPKVARLMEQGPPPAVAQTFGDAFYFAFHSLTAAAELALGLQELFSTPGQLQTLSQPLRIRIALHAGPLMSCHDPVSNRTNYTGRHTSKVARVEPVAPENQILTTQQFAALAATLPDQPYEFAYVGERMLPKDYGSERLYLLTPTTN